MLGLVLPATAVAHRRWGRLHLPICELPAGAPEPPSRDKRLAALLARVLSVSRAVMLLVTNSDGSAFAPKSLSSYLKKKKLPVSEDLEENATTLVAHLESEGDSAARGLRHECLRSVISPERLATLFPEIKAAYVQQPLDYGSHSRYGDKWHISCYLVVMDSFVPKIQPHFPMLRVLGPVMNECCRAFEAWYKGLFDSTVQVRVMNGFVTRYRPIHGEDQLKKHIDGVDVDGSVILALPTDEPFEGGSLRVWDGPKKQEFNYSMLPGDIIFLDRMIWHQGLPISTGTRYALVLFLAFEGR